MTPVEYVTVRGSRVRSEEGHDWVDDGQNSDHNANVRVSSSILRAKGLFVFRQKLTKR